MYSDFTQIVPQNASNRTLTPQIGPQRASNKYKMCLNDGGGGGGNLKVHEIGPQSASKCTLVYTTVQLYTLYTLNVHFVLLVHSKCTLCTLLHSKCTLCTL